MTEPGALQTVERELRTPRAAGIAGLAFTFLLTASLFMLRAHPESGSSADEIADYYLNQNAGTLSLVGLYLVPFSGIAFLWFIAVIRDRIGEHEDRFFATAFLGSGLLFIAMLFAAAAAGGALISAVKFLDEPAPSPETVLLARALAYTFLFVFALRAAAVFVVVVSTIALRTAALPRWLALAGYPVALVLLLSVTDYEATALVFPGWVGVVSIVILVWQRAEGRPA